MIKNLKFILLILIITNSVFSQKNERYFMDNGLSGATVLLFKDGTFNFESGSCETSNFAFGKWTLEKNIVSLIGTDISNFKVIKKVTARHLNNDKLTVKIFDNQGKNITDKITILQFFDKTNNYEMVLDEGNAKTASIKSTISKKTNGIIALTSLQDLFMQAIIVRTDTLNYYEIVLNISNDWIYNANSEWFKYGNHTFKKTSEGLIFIDKNGKLTEVLFKVSKK